MLKSKHNRQDVYKRQAMVSVSLIVSLITDICYVIYVFFVLKNRFAFNRPEKGLFSDLFAYTAVSYTHL